MLQELKATTLSKGLSDAQLARIAEHCHRESYPAGHKLCEADDILQKLYIIINGCLKGVIERNGQPPTKSFFNSGEVLGQYSLLFNEGALADIYVEFETTVFTIDRPTFMELLEEIPQLRKTLGQAVRTRIKSALRGDKMRRFARNIVFVRPSSVSTNVAIDVANNLAKRGEVVAFVSSDNVNSSHVTHIPVDLERGLTAQHSEFESTDFDRVIFDLEPDTAANNLRLVDYCNEVLLCFSSDDRDHMLPLIDQVFEASPENASKIKRVCLLNAGELVAPHGLVDDRLHKRDFIMPATDAGAEVRHYRQGIQRITRHLCDVKTGLALAGGGARGLVHFGILRALDRAEISFDMISGTSAGAMFGLSYATGETIEFLIDAYTKDLTPFWPFSWMPNSDRWWLLWEFRTRGWDRMLRQYFDCQFEQLQTPFAAVTVDLVQGAEIVRESGDIIDAMLESLNLPGIARPILKDGKALVDGGVLNNLPASVLVDRGADYVVGVNVSSEITEEFGKNRPGMTTSEMKKVGNLETLFRVLEVMGKGTADIQRSAVDFLLTPDTSMFSFTDFTNGEGLAEAGEAVVEQALPELHENINRLMRFDRHQ